MLSKEVFSLLFFCLICAFYVFIKFFVFSIEVRFADELKHVLFGQNYSKYIYHFVAMS